MDPDLFAEGAAHDVVGQLLIAQPSMDVVPNAQNNRMEWVHSACKDGDDCVDDSDGFCHCRFRYFLIIGRSLEFICLFICTLSSEHIYLYSFFRTHS